MDKKTFINKYRGFDIYQLDAKTWAYFSGDFMWRKTNSAWGCVVAIDEQLSP